MTKIIMQKNDLIMINDYCVERKSKQSNNFNMQIRRLYLLLNEFYQLV